MQSVIFDVVVVGAGVMGASTAFALARSGARVGLFERFEIGHARGSSHGASRIFRFSYRDATYVAMAQEALGMWRELEEASGRQLLTITGGLDAGEGIELNVHALERCDAPFEMLDARVVKERWPYLRIESNETVLFQPHGGFVAAEPAWRTFVEQARRYGAQLYERSAVQALEPAGDKVKIVTETGVVEAGRAVVTAGAWGRELLAGAGIDLPTRETRETVAYFDFPGTPMPFCDWGHPTMYSLPDPGRGLKAGGHHAGTTADPNEAGTPDPAIATATAEWVARRYPDIDTSAPRAESCFYTTTEDERFILERHGPIVVGSPCSGHGFKFAPLIGRRLAQLVTG